MTEFKWHREVVTPSTYLKEDKDKLDKSKDYSLEEKSVSNGEKKIVLSEDLISIISKSKSEKAYEAASDVRKFEIGLFWQRAAYFWAFITVVYTAYFKVLTEIYEKQHGYLPLIILSLLGLFFSFSWFLTSKASKHWQENWELHLDLLEDEVTGPLYKTYLAEKSYSVSKVNIYAGFIVSVCSFGLLIYEFAIFEKKYLHITGWLGILVCFLFAIIILFGLFTYAMFSIGNKKTLGQVAMQRKVYEKISNKRNE